MLTCEICVLKQSNNNFFKCECAFSCCFDCISQSISDGNMKCYGCMKIISLTEFISGHDGKMLKNFMKLMHKLIIEREKSMRQDTMIKALKRKYLKIINNFYNDYYFNNVTMSSEYLQDTE